MQRSSAVSANQSECSKQSGGPPPERSLRENNQQATGEGALLRESKRKLMDYSPEHLNRSKSFFTPVAQSYLLCNLIPSYFLARWLAAAEEVGLVDAYLARQERSFIGDRARFA